MDMCYDGTLVMPSNCVVIDEEEMTYVDGGFYISYNTIRGVILTACINTIAVTLVGITCYKLASLIAAKAGILGLKIGTLGGPIVSLISGVVSAAIGGAAALTIARALIERKGIGVDLVYSRFGIPYWVEINIR